jgi:hypothetical protein
MATQSNSGNAGLQLRVGNDFLDLPPGFDAQLNRFNPLFQTEGVIRDDFTLPISLPHTDHNSRVLRHPDVVENASRFQVRTDAVLYYNGMPQLRGQLRIKSPVNTDRITVNFVSGVSEISADLAERSLREIMDEEIVIHSTDFNREITLTYQTAVSTVYAIRILDRSFEEDTLSDLINAINTEPDFPFTASTPDTDQLTITPAFDSEFTDFWVGFLPGSEWRLTAEPAYTAAYQAVYESFVNQFRGENPDNRLRFPTNANFHGFFEGGTNKQYPIVNSYLENEFAKNYVFQPATGGTLIGSFGTPRVWNNTSLAPYVTVEYVLERIAAHYGITIIAPFVGNSISKMIIDHPNTIDRPVRYIENENIILFERSFNLADLVPDMKVNDFLKSLQGIGYALTFDQGSRTLEYFLRDPIIVQADSVDLSDRHAIITDVQNQPRKGVTFRHLVDESDVITVNGTPNEQNGKKPLIIGAGEKSVQTGFAVPIVKDMAQFFPPDINLAKNVVTKNQAPSRGFALRLAYALESIFLSPSMLINNGTQSLSWYGAEGLAATTWKNWKELENESTTVEMELFLREQEALRDPIWLKKVLIDRNKYLIRSYEVSISDGGDFQLCQAILVRIPYSERNGG